MGSLTCLVHVFVFLICFSTFSEARDFEVSWKISSKPDRLSHWASKMRFQIGDSLVIKFDPKADSLLQVSEESFKTCNASNPVKTYDNGDTKIVLDHSGPYYFISGVQDHCQKGVKMTVRVLSAKHSGRGHAPGASPAISPAQSPAPAISEVSQAQPPAHNGGGSVKSGAGALVLALMVVSLVGMILG